MSDSQASSEATNGASVAVSLGYPNNRVEVSAQPTGWQASVVLPSGLADQSEATTHKIQK